MNSIIIPNYKPLNTPYSTWALFRSKELLAANGFDNNEAAWQKATFHSEGLIRETAYFLLSRQTGKQNLELFRAGLDDIDKTVQAFCAFSLFKSGDQSAISKLKAISKLDINSNIAAIQAAGLLGQLGIPEAFEVIKMAMENNLEYIQLFGIQNAFYFIPINKNSYFSDHKVDIWEIYRKALNNKSLQIKTVAVAQLKEIKSKKLQVIPTDIDV